MLTFARLLETRYNPAVAKSVRIQYGGSVKGRERGDAAVPAKHRRSTGGRSLAKSRRLPRHCHGSTSGLGLKPKV